MIRNIGEDGEILLSVLTSHSRENIDVPEYAYGFFLHDI